MGVDYTAFVAYGVTVKKMPEGCGCGHRGVRFEVPTDSDGRLQQAIAATGVEVDGPPAWIVGLHVW